jgi:hypothetical protein
MTGCGGADDDGPRVEAQARPLAALCAAEVDGSGRVDVETDYLPHVIACENGGADFAALQAQAVAARTYLYYKIGRQGHIGDGQGDQVYSCGRGPGQQHIDAAASTAGQVLRYHGDVIAAFYVAGAIPSTPDCRPAPGDRDPTGTEHFVTYNEGRAGGEIDQTTLGWVHPENWANRGCKSQNGADCLAEHGYAWEDIVRFYYGEDIEITGAEGECVPAAPPPPLAPDAAPLPPLPDAAPPPPPPDAALADGTSSPPPTADATPPAPPPDDPSLADAEVPVEAPSLDAGGPGAPARPGPAPARTTAADLSGGCAAAPAGAPGPLGPLWSLLVASVLLFRCPWKPRRR